MRSEVYFDMVPKNKTLRVFFPGLVLLMFNIFACSFFQNLGQPAIPQSALEGVKPASTRILGHFRLADWAEGVSTSQYITIFQAYQLQNDAAEIRVFLNDNGASQYIGMLTDQLQIPGVKTAFIDFGSQRCIIGWVSPDLAGNLLFFHIERVPKDPTRRMQEAVLESTIEKNVFIVPIRADASPELWNSIALAAVKTKESLQRGFDQKGSYYQIEKSYDPPLDVSGFYLHILLNK